MKLVVIDGQGGRLGRMLVEGILERFPEASLTAVGTNTLATSSMIKGGARRAATGENAVIVACRDADVIVGPVGMVVADALYGEITPAMACAVGQSRAARVLIPLSKCDTAVAGLRSDLGAQELIADALDKIAELAK